MRGHFSTWRVIFAAFWLIGCEAAIIESEEDTYEQTESCGNGILETGEACDDSNLSNQDACLSTCVVASCGDGFLRTDITNPSDPAYEFCDAGEANSDTTPDACRAVQFTYVTACSCESRLGGRRASWRSTGSTGSPSRGACATSHHRAPTSSASRAPSAPSSSSHGSC